MTSQKPSIFPSLTTRSTIMIAGEHQQVRVDVTSALTTSAAVFVTFGAVRMVFTDPAVARALITALRRPQSGGYLMALPEHFMLSPDRFASDEHLVTVNWSQVPQTSVVPGGAFSPERRRHVHWVDVEAGPLTLRFFDKAGHKAFVAELARTVQVARSVLLPADEKALALHGHN